jgi:non-homologous end joining protein Ku
MVRTIPLPGGDYMEVPDAELERLEAMPSPVMQLHRTVPLNLVDVLYVDRHYLLVPRPGGEPAYAALAAALGAERCAGVVQVVLRHRECTALVSPNAGGLLHSTLRASEDVIAYQALTDLAAGLPAVSEQETGLVRQLLRSLPSGVAYQELRDPYRERLLAFIGETGECNPAPPHIVGIDDLLTMAEAS